MKKYFEAKLSYVKIDDTGRERKVTEPYILEAVSFTDAEAIMTELGRQITRGEFVVKGIKESNIEHILNNEGDTAYKAKIKTVSLDEDAGKEITFTSYWLVFAGDFYAAYKNIAKEMESIVVPVVVEAMAVVPIVELVDVMVTENAE